MDLVKFISSMIGVCFGGYCPLHQGHLDVIMRAKKETDLCYVVVCGYESEPRGEDLGKDIKQRTQMVREFFRGDNLIKVISVNDTELGLDESMSENNWRIWTSYVKTRIPESDDLIFYVGEPRYTEDLKKVGYNSILVGYDYSRGCRVNDISASKIRENPLRWWRKIAYPFKPGLTKKILVLGTASEGKTTLVQDISKYFQIPCTTEFGRDYMEKSCMLDPDLYVKDFSEFLLGQYRYYCEALEDRGNPGVIISDTDNLVTLMYAKAYLGNPEMNITEEDYENILVPLAKSLHSLISWDKIYLIKPHNIFVDDGTRYMAQSSMSERNKNYEILVNLLKEFELWGKVEILNGTYFEHFEILKNYIYELYQV